MQKLDQLIGFLFRPAMAKWFMVFFVVYYSSISLVNHYMFRTSSDPLAIYTNALYDYAHFRPNDCKLLSPINAKLNDAYFDNKLSDHFTLTQMLFAPFIYVFGTYTLLIFQLLAIMIGGWGVYRFFQFTSQKNWLALMAMVHFFWVYGIHSALAFDYHDNVIGAMLVPWLFYFLLREKWKWFVPILLLTLGCKETLSVLLFGIFAVLAILPFKKSRSQRWVAGLSAAFSLLYFLVVTKWAMPALANEGRESYLHFHYSALGETYGEALQYAITHPWETAKMFFTNHTGSPHGDGIKMELYIILLLSGGFAWFFRPAFLLMAIPIIAQKVLNDDIGKWGINYQYNIELVPIITFALFGWISQKPDNAIWKRIAFAMILVAMCTTVASYIGRKAKWYDPYRQNPFSPTHYSRAFSVSQLYTALDNYIPDNENVGVSAHFNIVPHIPFRKDLYEFPTVDEAEYIVVLRDAGFYPYKSQERYNVEIDRYIQNPDWQVLYQANQTVIMQRKVVDQ